MRLSKEDYNRAVGYLKRYCNNCLTIINVRADIISIGAAATDGMPKAPYKISDSVYSQVLQLQENKELQKAIKEWKTIQQALTLVGDDSNYIFEEFYMKGKPKWEVIDKMHTSEETFKRRKRDLIYAVDREIKKMTQF